MTVYIVFLNSTIEGVYRTQEDAENVLKLARYRADADDWYLEAWSVK